MNPLEKLAIELTIEAAQIASKKPSITSALRLASIQSHIFAEAARFARANDKITEEELGKLLDIASVAADMDKLLEAELPTGIRN